MTEAERRSGELAGTQDVAVAFADLVDYTRLGEKLPLEDVGRIATRLAELAGAATVRPAQLVKTIGDAAMFVSPEVPAMMATDHRARRQAWRRRATISQRFGPASPTAPPPRAGEIGSGPQ